MVGPLVAASPLALWMVSMRFRLLFSAWVVLLLVACQGVGPRSDAGPTPAQVLASGKSGDPIHWGGRIVRVENLRERTRIEVLYLPLDRRGRPEPARRTQGRFIVVQAGFLDPHEYATDRLLEVEGHLSGFFSGEVGDAAYRYPVVRADRLALWPDAETEQGRLSSPRVNIGIGASNHGGGIGVGIGF